ncbi:MAG: response regulator, partial [Oscillospiraceae bacterium]|nr:response regulator [Oscillospiraceae bacterium]
MSEQIFTIVVADDEQELREAVCGMIRWEEIGFRLVGSAGNGLDALQMVEQLQPDLLLTDIRMPFINGTALARQVRELQPLIQVAFLSGYDDFEYAQSAIDSEVIAYLLKPISMAELTQALREIHARMEARFNALRPTGAGGSLPLAVASLLLDSFAEQPEEEELRRMLVDCGMVFTAPYELTVLAVRAGRLEQDAAQTVDQVLRKYYSCCSFVSGGRVLSLLVSEDGFARLGAALDELYYVGKRLLDENCVIGVSRSFSQLRRCTAACREAVDTQRLAGESGIYRIGQIQARLEERAQDEQDAAARLATLLYGGSREALEAHLRRVLAEGGSDMTAMRLLLAAQ